MEKKRSAEKIYKWNICKELKRILKNKPRTPFDNKYIGLLYHLDLHEYKKAIIYYKKALALAPTNCEFLRSLARVYIDQKDYKNALYYLKKAINLKPKDKETFKYFSMVYSDMVEHYVKLGKRIKVRKCLDENIKYAFKSKDKDELKLLIFHIILNGDRRGRDKKTLIKIAKILPNEIELRRLIYSCSSSKGTV